MRDGIAHHAPSMASSGDGFRPEYFDELARLESNNFWFRSRSQLVIDAIGRYFPHRRNFLEIGCGTGYVLMGIGQAFPEMTLSGSELFIEGLAYAARRVPAAELMQMDARRIPYRDEFDLIGAFDVIEHIEDHEAVLKAIHAALVPGGGVIITVPQHPWLWSRSDDYACHVRRYERGQMERMLEQAGMRVVFSSSFVSILMPLLAMSRLTSRRRDDGGDPASELKLPAIVNACLYGVLQVERFLIRLGVRFPFGGTRLVCAEKTR